MNNVYSSWIMKKSPIFNMYNSIFFFKCDLNIGFRLKGTITGAKSWRIMAEWLERQTQPKGRGFESRRKHGTVSVSRIP
jgi:hypothetical protein